MQNVKNKRKQNPNKTKQQAHRYREKEVDWGLGKMGEGDQKVQTSSYKIKKISNGDVMYSMMTNNTLLHI